MCCGFLVFAVWACVAGMLVKIAAGCFARRMPKPAAYVLGCAITFGCTLVGSVAGILIGGKVGAAIDRREEAKRSFSADNLKVAETSFELLGAQLGAIAVMSVVAPVFAWLAARQDDDDDES